MDEVILIDHYSLIYEYQIQSYNLQRRLYSYAKAEGWGIISAGLLLIFKGTIILCVGQCGVDS